jgi:DMSO/TMAO reductase YedYZ molybdopterin-dependent catalytic subunit
MPPETKERVTVAAGDRPLPPGQHVPRVWPALHYGRVPAFHPARWNLRIFGATEDGADHRWPWPGFCALPRTRVVADFHCVTKFSIPDVAWDGVPATALLSLAPPAPSVTHVMIWAEYGYSANLRIADFAADDTLKSVKWVRAIEYLTRDRRGFWEERGYHNVADPWREQRYSHQENPGEGPPL